LGWGGGEWTGLEVKSEAHSVSKNPSAMAELLFTRGDLVKNFTTNFSRDALESHFSCEYVKVTGCIPDIALVKALLIISANYGRVSRERLLSFLQHAERPSCLLTCQLKL
jgi:hypothetical protein